MKKVIIAMIGIALVVSVIATGTYGLPEENIAIYEQAIALEDENGDFGFQGFSLTNYPVSFYDGNKDYVIEWENGKYSIKKRKATFNSLVATAYPVEEHYEVLTPTVEKMSSLLSPMTGGEIEYGADEHVATLWHEAFHCWQLTNYLDNVESICPVEIDESIIAEYVDTNEQAVSLYEQQSTLLKEAVMTPG